MSPNVAPGRTAHDTKSSGRPATFSDEAKNSMKETKRGGSSGSATKGARKKEKGKYILRLYVSGMTQRSMLAIQNIRKICDEQLKGRCDLQVIDIYAQPVLAKGEQIIATPTLIKKLPPPLRKFIGDLTNADRILMGLDLRVQKKTEPPQLD
jgi:circadian clock protein KaiB